MKLRPPTTESVLQSPEAVLTGMLSLCRYLASSSDAERIAVTTGLRAELWDVRTGKQVGVARPWCGTARAGPQTPGPRSGSRAPRSPGPARSSGPTAKRSSPQRLR
jgi:hypothetical protein